MDSSYISYIVSSLLFHMRRQIRLFKPNNPPSGRHTLNPDGYVCHPPHFGHFTGAGYTVHIHSISGPVNL